MASILLTFWCLAVAVTLVWWLSVGPSDRWPWLGAAAVLLAAGVAHSGWRRLPEGVLHWGGLAWTWQSPGYPAGTPVIDVQLVLDMQRLLLIRMRNPADAQWLVWADAATDPGHWLDFRRALYAHAQPPGGPLPAAGRQAQP